VSGKAGLVAGICLALLVLAGFVALIFLSVTRVPRTASWLASQVELKDGQLLVAGLPVGTTQEDHALARKFGWTDRDPENWLCRYNALVPMNVWEENEGGTFTGANFSVSDFDGIDTTDIKPMYGSIREQLTNSLHVQSQVFPWKDEMTYPRLSTVWTIGPSRVILTVGTSNDNRWLKLQVLADGRQLVEDFKNHVTAETPLPDW